MRRSIFILLMSVAACGCSLKNNYPLGTSEAEFTKKNKMLIDLAEKSTERTVYKKTTATGDLLYYYFVDGKLVRIDEGIQQPAVVVEHVGGVR
ncbi:MAG: hypothetical protein JKY70_15950 [Mucilaginibacter sp.]|nr:hypothetical protein [Mucilaginibacter sp.]